MQRRQLLQFAIGSGALLATPYSLADSAQYSPANLAFITDIIRHTIAIADITRGTQTGILDLPILPKLIASSKDAPYLAFTDRIISGVYLYDLATQRLHHFDLPTPAYRLFFLPKTSLLIVALESQIALLDYKSGNLDILPDHFQAKFAHFSTVINSISGHISVLQQRSNGIKTIHIPQREPQWQTLPVGGEHGFAHGMTNPANTILAFTDYHRDTAYLYDTEREILLDQFPSDDDTLFIDPYISDSGHAAFATLGGILRVYLDPHSPEQIISTQLDFIPRYLRSGWLDKYLVIAGDGCLQIRDFTTLDVIAEQYFSTDQPIMNIWISGSSKYVLFTRSGQNALFVYDLQRLTLRHIIDLPALEQPYRIVMNSSNNICF
ncbi:hypothetical protein KRX19_02335 [Cardiobacteriaceae bacterium TAE3-ERU3]|nr:hypothetical protein [Cardiobacteriaceae bacterium TAE3-ERU3]